MAQAEQSTDLLVRHPSPHAIKLCRKLKQETETAGHNSIIIVDRVVGQSYCSIVYDSVT